MDESINNLRNNILISFCSYEYDFMLEDDKIDKN